MRVVAISDVHGKWNKLTIPPCNVLVSTGDYSFRGEKHMVKDFHTWLNKQPADHIISVQGNHEVWVEQNFEEAKLLAEIEKLMNRTLLRLPVPDVAGGVGSDPFFYMPYTASTQKAEQANSESTAPKSSIQKAKPAVGALLGGIKKK